MPQQYGLGYKFPFPQTNMGQEDVAMYTRTGMHAIQTPPQDNSCDSLLGDANRASYMVLEASSVENALF